MNFDQRKAVAREMLMQFLERFSAPRGLSDEAQAKTIAGTSEAFARKLPVVSEDKYREHIEATFTKVLDSHASYAWPPQAEFVEAMPRPSSAKAPETFKAQDHTAIVDMMQAGEPVPDVYIWGSRSHEVGRLVGSEVMHRYREGSVRAYREAYRQEAKRIMSQKYGAQVERFFLEAAE